MCHGYHDAHTRNVFANLALHKIGFVIFNHRLPRRTSAGVMLGYPSRFQLGMATHAHFGQLTDRNIQVIHTHLFVVVLCSCQCATVCSGTGYEDCVHATPLSIRADHYTAQCNCDSSMGICSEKLIQNN